MGVKGVLFATILATTLATASSIGIIYAKHFSKVKEIELKCNYNTDGNKIITISYEEIPVGERVNEENIYKYTVLGNDSIEINVKNVSEVKLENFKFHMGTLDTLHDCFRVVKKTGAQNGYFIHFDDTNDNFKNFEITNAIKNDTISVYYVDGDKVSQAQEINLLFIGKPKKIEASNPETDYYYNNLIDFSPTQTEISKYMVKLSTFNYQDTLINGLSYNINFDFYNPEESSDIKILGPDFATDSDPLQLEYSSSFNAGEIPFYLIDKDGTVIDSNNENINWSVTSDDSKASFQFRADAHKKNILRWNTTGVDSGTKTFIVTANWTKNDGHTVTTAKTYPYKIISHNASRNYNPTIVTSLTDDKSLHIKKAYGYYLTAYDQNGAEMEGGTFSIPSNNSNFKVSSSKILNAYSDDALAPASTSFEIEYKHQGSLTPVETKKTIERYSFIEDTTPEQHQNNFDWHAWLKEITNFNGNNHITFESVSENKPIFSDSPKFAKIINCVMSVKIKNYFTEQNNEMKKLTGFFNFPLKIHM